METPVDRKGKVISRQGRELARELSPKGVRENDFVTFRIHLVVVLLSPRERERRCPMESGGTGGIARQKGKGEKRREMRRGGREGCEEWEGRGREERVFPLYSR